MSEPTAKTSPFVIAASIAVIIASLVGIGAMTGLIPGRGSQPETPAVTATSQTAGTPASPAQPTASTEEKAAVSPPDPAAKRAAKTTRDEPTTKSSSGQRTEMAEKDAGMDVCGNCGVISSIRAFEQAGEGSGLGVVAGGVVGGLLGHQVGGGTGKDLATIAGAVGGGYAGHQIEKKVKSTTRYKITVRMDDGSLRTLTKKTEPPFAIGEKVKIIDGALVRN